MPPRTPPLIAAVLLLSLAAAQPDAPRAVADPAITVRSAPLAPRTVCEGRFVAHPLEHVTRARGERVRFYDSNGAGVAAGDLDGDGDLDLALADLAGPNAVLWNEGGFVFRREALELGGSRAVQMVDVDGDGRLDLVFTQGVGALLHWRNDGGRFRREPLPGVLTPAYAMAWGDLDRDGDLDLVTASYDTLIEKERPETLFGSGAGVVAYARTPEGFVGQRLAERAQALAVAFYDVDGDGLRDLIVGNDFELPDAVWRVTAEGFETAEPFRITTRNTMGFDPVDMDNDGRFELFATDMKPAFDDPVALAAWMPLMDRSYHRTVAGRVQVEENILHDPTPSGFRNLAYRLGIDATGWSWSGRFGDLDHDGRLDLYVVNGMIAADVFAHLPGDELVERNRVFRQTRRGFEPAPGWDLDARESGRGMTLADLDGDGDLDVVINNLEAPALAFENRLCGGSALQVALRWPESGNSHALGATLRLTTSEGTQTRELRSGAGYLSGDPPVAHFGLPDGARAERLKIVWPDGRSSVVADLSEHARVTVTREGTP